MSLEFAEWTAWPAAQPLGRRNGRWVERDRVAKYSRNESDPLLLRLWQTLVRHSPSRRERTTRAPCGGKMNAQSPARAVAMIGFMAILPVCAKGWPCLDDVVPWFERWSGTFSNWRGGSAHYSAIVIVGGARRRCRLQPRSIAQSARSDRSIVAGDTRRNIGLLRADARSPRLGIQASRIPSIGVCNGASGKRPTPAGHGRRS
jgi:hypothetical protein